VAAQAGRQRGPGPVEAPGSGERAEGQHALSAVAAPALPRAPRPGRHENPVDRVAGGGVRVVHAAAVTAEEGQMLSVCTQTDGAPLAQSDGHRPAAFMVEAILQGFLEGKAGVHALRTACAVSFCTPDRA